MVFFLYLWKERGYVRCHFEYARPIPFPSLSVPRQDGGMQLHIKCSRMLAPRFLTHKTPNSKTLQILLREKPKNSTDSFWERNHFRCVSCGWLFEHAQPIWIVKLYRYSQFLREKPFQVGFWWLWLFEHARPIPFPSLWTAWHDCGMRAPRCRIEICIFHLDLHVGQGLSAQLNPI